MEWGFDRRLAIGGLVLSLVIAIAGLGITILFPDARRFGWALLWVAGGLFFLWVAFESWLWLHSRWGTAGISVLAGCIIFGGLFYLKLNAEKSESPKAPLPNSHGEPPVPPSSRPAVPAPKRIGTPTPCEIHLEDFPTTVIADKLREQSVAIRNAWEAWFINQDIPLEQSENKFNIDDPDDPVKTRKAKEEKEKIEKIRGKLRDKFDADIRVPLCKAEAARAMAFIRMGNSTLLAEDLKEKLLFEELVTGKTRYSYIRGEVDIPKHLADLSQRLHRFDDVPVRR